MLEFFLFFKGFIKLTVGNLRETNENESLIRGFQNHDENKNKEVRFREMIGTFISVLKTKGNAQKPLQ